MFTILVFMSVIFSQAEAGIAKCTVVATPVEEGRPTAITCYFDEDVRETKSSVNVYKITPDNKQVLVASFVWPSDTTEPTVTVFLKGYRMTQPDGRTLSIMIDSATLDQTGDYMCQLLHVNHEGEQNTCHFEVTEKASKTSCKVESVVAGGNTTLTCNFNKNILRGHRIYVLQKRSYFDDDKEFKPVVDCSQDENVRQFPVCKSTVEGYHVIPNQTTTRSLLVHMVNVSKDSEGTYICRVVSSVNPEREDTCDLRLTVPATADLNIWKIIGIIIVCVIGVLDGVFLYIYLKRRKKIKTVTSEGAQQAQSEEMTNSPDEPRTRERLINLEQPTNLQANDRKMSTDRLNLYSFFSRYFLKHEFVSQDTEMDG